MEKGFIALVLHAHLPFVRHPDIERPAEERWFFEALTECYLPLLDMLEHQAADAVAARFTLSLSPTLLCMMADPLLQSRYIDHLSLTADLCRHEIKRTRSEPDCNRLARRYHETCSRAAHLFEHRWKRNLAGAFKEFQENGRIEIITTSATHAFLPLMSGNPRALGAQIKVAMACYERFFETTPEGFWLPECGIDDLTAEKLGREHSGYCFVDAHGVLHASPRPQCGVFAPVQSPAGVIVFGRDIASSRQVWSSRDGYPGNPVYRDFYRDIGYDLDYDYIRPYLPGDGLRSPTGIKYHRITGPEDKKQIYDPGHAGAAALRDADHFSACRQQQIDHLACLLNRPPIVVTAFDAELFGHWWHEGPQWLDAFIRRAAQQHHSYPLITPSDYLARFPVIQKAAPSPSSWGWAGYNESWVNDTNAWIYRHLHKAAEWMNELTDRFTLAQGLERRALNQAARELLLAQSSDWPFIMATGTVTDYAVKRITGHLEHFSLLRTGLLSGTIDTALLSSLEATNTVFPDIDYRVFRYTS